MFRFLIFFCAIFFTTNVFASKVQLQKPKAIIELFTSQGCSSCPPADRIIGEYAKGKNILPFSWHVDYWNYLGWQDTFSQQVFTQRQKNYAVSFVARNIYTPQAVINGRDHVVGSARQKIENKIIEYEKTGRGIIVPIFFQRKDNVLNFSASHELLAQKNVFATLIYFNRQSTVEIKRGENSGKEITYHNIVKSHEVLQNTINGDSFFASIKHNSSGDSLAILLQVDRNGILGEIIGGGVLYNIGNF